jgi:hypothetical protein
MRQKRLVRFQEIGNKRHDDDMFVDLTIYDIPASLLKEFGEKIVQPQYPSGVNEAIKDLIRKAVLEERLSRSDAALLTT